MLPIENPRSCVGKRFYNNMVSLAGVYYPSRVYCTDEIVDIDRLLSPVPNVSIIDFDILNIFLPTGYNLGQVIAKTNLNKICFHL